MEKENPIDLLKQERSKIVEEEKLLESKFKRASKLDKALKDTFGVSMFLGWVLLNVGVAIWAYFYYEEFTWSRFWYHFLINLYPGLFVCAFIGIFIDPFVPAILHKFYGISKKDVEAFKSKKDELIQIRWDLDKKISQEESSLREAEIRRQWVKKREEDKQVEIKLLDGLKELIAKIESKKINNTEGNEWRNILSDDNRKVRAAGYQIEKSITYTNLFKKLEKLLDQSITSPVGPANKQVESATEESTSPISVKPLTLSRDYQEKAKQQYLRIESEAYFENRLDWFLSMLTKGQVPIKQTKLIHTLLKEEFREYQGKGFIIHPLEHYSKKVKDIYSIISGEKTEQITEPSIESGGVKIPTTKKIDPIALANTEEPKIEDKTVVEIFGNPNDFKKTRVTKEASIKVLPKQDLHAINKQKIDVGDAGELFVYWKEKNKLFDSGFKLLSDKVQHVSTQSDSHGYDIVSYFEDGTPIYLEVKTTIGGPKTPFDMSTKELAAMNTLDNYYIVRVFDFNMATGKGSTYTVNKSQFGNHFDLEPTSYRAKPKK